MVANRVEEASGQSSKPSVPQTCIGLLFQQSDPIDLFLLNRMLRDRIEQQIGDVVRQRAPDEKLHREIVDTLRIFTFVGAFSMYPALRKDVADRVGKRFKPRPSVGCDELHDVVENKMAIRTGSYLFQKTGPVHNHIAEGVSKYHSATVGIGTTVPIRSLSGLFGFVTLLVFIESDLIDWLCRSCS